jgi:phage-related protein (TIGR01555 family)
MTTKMGKALAEMGPEALASAALQVRNDAWQNDQTGFGTAKDKTQYGFFQPLLPLTTQQCANLYHGDAMAARMVDVVPQEVFREGFAVEIDDEAVVNDWLAEKFRDIDARGKLQEGWTWGDLFGGGGCIIGCDDGRPASMPLMPERAKALTYLYPIDRRMLWPVSYYQDPGNPKLGKVETYLVTPASANAGPTQVIHESRLIIFRGAMTGIRERVLLGSWNYSVLQRPYEVLRQYNVGWNSLELMMTDGNLPIFKMNGLGPAIASGNTAAIQARLALISQRISNVQALVLDAGDPSDDGDPAESFDRQQLSYEGIPQALDKLMLRLASAVQIPVTILMGQSPAGMSATGDSDFRWFYDRIRALQQNRLAPRLRHLAQIMLATQESPLKAEPDAISVKFPGLWKETPSVEAARRFSMAQADAAYVTAGVLTPEEVALARFGGDGFGEDIRLSDEAVEARNAALNIDLPKMSEGTPEAPEPSGFGGGGGFGKPAGKFDEAYPKSRDISYALSRDGKLWDTVPARFDDADMPDMPAAPPASRDRDELGKYLWMGGGADTSGKLAIDSMPSWQKTASGYTFGNGQAQLVKSGKAWELHSAGRIVKLPKKSTFDHAERAFVLLKTGKL